MKRMIALLLVAAALFALAIPAGAAFSDAGKIAQSHKAAVDYVSEKNIISGFPDGTFRPQETLTRAQAAKIICVAREGADKANALTKAETGFNDVAAFHWAAKFVAYCVEQGIVAGVGSGKFDPDGKLSSAAFAKMLLVAYGKAKAEELVGAKWLANTQKALKDNALDEGVAPVENTPMTRENACRMVYNFLTASQPDADGYATATLAFTDAGKYRLLGRAKQEKDGVVCNGCADGVEFTVDCKGTIKLTASVSAIETYNVTYRVLVDGVASEQMSFSSAGEKSATLFVDVKPGVHTIRVVKDYEPSHSRDLLKSVTLTCKPESVKPTAQKSKLLAIIGDSDVSGFGVIKTSTPDSTKNSSSAILSFGYLAAEQLGVDYEIMSRRSMGALKTVGKPKKYNYQEMFEYRNRWLDNDEKYDFARKADAVMIKVSGNDKSFSAEEETAAMMTVIGQVREHYGKDVPIVIFYTQSTKHKPVAEELVAGDPKLYGVTVTYDRSGMGDHSTAASHVYYAEELVKVLKPLLG
ncbi:MAG: S-layer homology domain-containing protein [Oscillospiraceae bacterium]|nr:S-layer homology domain-containing protein [Oscillospiraceae bacterium]